MLIEGINVSIPDRLFEGLEAFGDAPCLIDTSGTTLSYAQAIAQADGLFARPELPDGGLAFVFAPSTVLGVLAYIGAVRKGYAVHLLDPNKRAAADQLVETFDPDIIVDPGRTDPVQVRSAQASALHADIRILLSTSGSTGSSKLVKLSDRNICSNTASIIQYLGLTSEDRGITLLKLFYSYGMSVVNIHLHAGASLVVTEDGIDNPDFWLLLEREKVTNLSGVPFSFEFIRQSGRDVTRHRSLRLLTQAGGKLAAKHVQAFAGLRAQGGPDFFVMYGQTEAAPRISYLHPETAAKVPGSIGRAIPGGRLSLAEESGAEITETGVSGELIYEGPNVMVGYAHSRADLTFVEDIPRLATGDIAHMDSDGLFHIDGRSARFVKPFGLRISLDEVEERLSAKAGSVAVTGTDRHLIIALENAPDDPAQLSAEMAEAFALPESAFIFVTGQPIPRLASGKTDYRALLLAHSPKEAPKKVTSVFLQELTALLLGKSTEVRSVLDAFQSIMGQRATDTQASFRSLGGDSLTFMQLYLALEEYLGTVPDGWDDMTMFELEQFKGAQHV